MSRSLKPIRSVTILLTGNAHGAKLKAEALRTLCNIASGEIAPAGFKPETGLPRFPAQRRARVSPRPAYRRTRATPRPVRQKYIRQRRGCQPVILCRIRTDFSFFHRRQTTSALTRRGASCIHRIFRAVHISSSCTDSFYPPFESSGNIIQIIPLRTKRPKAFADLSGVSFGIKAAVFVGSAALIFRY